MRALTDHCSEFCTSHFLQSFLTQSMDLHNSFSGHLYLFLLFDSFLNYHNTKHVKPRAPVGPMGFIYSFFGKLTLPSLYILPKLK